MGDFNHGHIQWQSLESTGELVDNVNVHPLIIIEYVEERQDR